MLTGPVPHEVRFDETAESTIIVCSCGRRVLAPPRTAAQIIRAHLAATGDLHGALKKSRRLRMLAG